MDRKCSAAARAAIVIAAASIGLPSVAYACENIPCSPAWCAFVQQGKSHTHPPTHPPISNNDGGIKGPTLNGGPVYPSRNMTLQSNLPLASIGGGSDGSSLYGWVDPLTKREYAIMGRSNGTAFVDITNPTNPLYVANLPKVAGSQDTIWREPKVYQNTVYIGVDGATHGMQVMDLTRLRNYTGTTLQLTANSVYNGVTNIHTLAINKDTGFLYAVGSNLGGGGLHVLDVNNPSAPVARGTYATDGYTHETQVVKYHGPDAAYQGREIAFNSNGRSQSANDSLKIVDVTNKSAMATIGSGTYGTAGYIHQGWLTEDHRWFFQNDELDEGAGAQTRTHLWDVADLNNPVYRGAYVHSGVNHDHNLYIKDGYVYETNYKAGLRVLKIGDLTSSNPQTWLSEVAYFDTYPLNNNSGFEGAWNSYPFFPSGNIPISDINGGLFVVKMKNFPAQDDYGDGYIIGSPPSITGGGIGPERLLSSVPEPTSLGLAIGAGLLTLRRKRLK